MALHLRGQKGFYRQKGEKYQRQRKRELEKKLRDKKLRPQKDKKRFMGEKKLKRRGE